MNEQSREEGLTPSPAGPEIHIDWGYERPVRGSRTETPAVVRREITIEPPPARLATPPEGTIVVSPRLRAPHADYRIWITAFATVTAISLTLSTLVAIGLALF